jgi:DNA-binding transcriptional regulator YhcF (GntR family)
MAWNFLSDRPLYLQVQEFIKLSIVSGRHPPGSKLPTVRDLATEAAVNPNTMQRAFMELEREGLVHSQRTGGRYVTEDSSVIDSTKNKLAIEFTDAFLDKMEAIGYGAKETYALITANRKEADTNGDS